MPLDPNIALQVGQPVQPLDPMKAYGQVLTLKNLMDQQRMQGLQLEKAQRDEADARGLRSAYAVTPEGEIDEQTTIKNLVGGGYGPQAVDFRQKMQTDKSAAAKAEREAEKARLDALDKTIDITGQVLSSLGPNPTYGAAMDAALWLNQQGVKVDLNSIPEDPQKLAQFVQQRAWQTMSAKEQIAERRAAMEPKTDMGRIQYDYQRGLLPGGGEVTSEVGTDTANNPNATLNGPRVGFQSGGGNEMRDAALARAAYGAPPEGFRYVGRTQQLEPIPEVLAEKMKRAEASGTRVNVQNNAVPLGKAAETKVDEGLLDTSATLMRLNGIRKQYKPEWSEFSTQAGMKLNQLGEKYLGIKVAPAAQQKFRQYTQWRQKAKNNMNLTIQSLTGAAMGKEEAERIIATLPSDDDSPTEFQAKLDGAEEQTKMALARFTYIKRNRGMSIADVPLEAMPEVMRARDREIEGEVLRRYPNMDPAERNDLIKRQLAQEFGLIGK